MRQRTCTWGPGWRVELKHPRRLRKDSSHYQLPRRHLLTQYYRQVAAAIRALATSMRSQAARGGLSALAADYELLAKFVESCRTTESEAD
jgi:hypothetical protein